MFSPVVFTMSSPQFNLKCDNFSANVCNGLTSLQQREEFVDMTLAADGHLVKVHQIIVSLASPYLKELILSAPCPHPVVFLNKISYPTLCYILEYIYTGQVMVNKESIPDLVTAAKELHIKGLQDMNFQDTVGNRKQQSHASVERLQQYKSQTKPMGETSNHTNDYSVNEECFEETLDDSFTEHMEEEEHLEDDNRRVSQSLQPKSNADNVSLTLKQSHNTSAATSDHNEKTVQYTLSNQGSIQLVLNRFIYFLRYCHKNSDPPIRMWKCVDYIRTRCPASVTTKDDLVIQRVSAHKHGFHDKRIMKKLKNGQIFTAIKDAERKGLEESNKPKTSD